MDKALRSILWILVALVIFSSFSTGWFFVAKERLYNDYVNLDTLFDTTIGRLNRELTSSQEENKELKSRLVIVERDLNLLESRSTRLESEYEVILKERGDLTKELARVKKGKFYLEKKIKEFESDMFMAGLLKDRASLEVELARLKKSDAPKDKEIKSLKMEIISLASKFSEVKEEKESLAQKFRDSEEVTTILSRDLLKQKNDQGQYKEDFEDQKAENRLLKTKIVELEDAVGEFDRLSAAKADMELKVSRLERDLGHKNSEIERLNEAFHSQEKRGREGYRAEAYHAPQEVELPPIVVERDAVSKDRVSTSSFDWMDKRQGLKGRVVTINREHGFVVIDLGRQHGVDIGTRFKIYRDNLFIGTLEVIQHRERIAACDIEDIREGFYVDIDDLVVRQ